MNNLEAARRRVEQAAGLAALVGACYAAFLPVAAGHPLVVEGDQVVGDYEADS